MSFTNLRGSPNRHPKRLIFSSISNPTNETGFFYFTHQDSGAIFLCDVTYKLNLGKYYQEYFLTPNMVANNLAFNRGGKLFS